MLCVLILVVMEVDCMEVKIFNKVNLTVLILVVMEVDCINRRY
ncbi:Uncharacterised protein [Bacteroides heparinolyticus]|uniref:Uncharacterized protein n=1 Tax=Prevotella heparinolytica TaxID=28113 RepID=A0A449I2X7_9BACE|nr:Uncharacterised protein [Bacteroides heparinolyticus]